MEKDILIIKTRLQNQSPGSEPLQLAGLMACAFGRCGLSESRPSNNQWASKPAGGPGTLPSKGPLTGGKSCGLLKIYIYKANQRRKKGC